MFTLCSSLSSRLVAFPFWEGGTLPSPVLFNDGYLAVWFIIPFVLSLLSTLQACGYALTRPPHKLLCPVWPLRSGSHLWLSPQSIKHRKWHILSSVGHFEMQFAQSEQTRPGLIFDPFLVIFRLSWHSRCLPLANVWVGFCWCFGLAFLLFLYHNSSWLKRVWCLSVLPISRSLSFFSP